MCLICVNVVIITSHVFNVYNFVVEHVRDWCFVNRQRNEFVGVHVNRQRNENAEEKLVIQVVNNQYTADIIAGKDTSAELMKQCKRIYL